MFSEKCGICLEICFSNIFDTFGRILTGRWFPLISFLPFLYAGVIFASLRFSGNFDIFIELLKLVQRKSLKVSTFSFKSFTGISGFWDALFAPSFKIFFSISFLSTPAKLQLPLFLHLFQIATMLGCLLYFKIAFKARSSLEFIKCSSFEIIECGDVLKTSAVSSSVLKSSLF